MTSLNSPPPTSVQGPPPTVVTKQSLDDLCKTPVVTLPDVYNVERDLRFPRLVFYFLAIVDFSCIILLSLTLVRWNASDLDIPNVYLFLYLFQLPHLFSGAGLVAVLFGSRNFFFINMVAVIYGVAWLFDFASLIWRWVCIGVTVGSIGCPLVVSGLWLAWTSLALVVILFVVSSVALILLIFYIRGIKLNIQFETDLLMKQREQQLTCATIGGSTNAATATEAGQGGGIIDSKQAITFRQARALYYSRIAIRQLTGIDLMLYLLAALLRIIFFAGEGFWYTPYIHCPQVFLWIWLLDLAGSNDYKTPVLLGGTDASQSDLFARFVYGFFIFVEILTMGALALTVTDLVTVFLTSGIAELIAGYFITLFIILIIAYNLYIIISLSFLIGELTKKTKLKQQ